tara:strand:- start:177 stop:680 length:504 start_codon:yes stop_codon:yes gene_type:complete
VTFGSWKKWIINGIVVIAIYFAFSVWHSRELIPNKKNAPEFQLSNIFGSLVNLNEFRGERVLLYFFAPWCKICDLNVNNLNWLKKLRGKEVQIIAIALSYNNLNSIESFVDRNNLEVPVLLGSNEIINSYQIKAFPTIYTLNETGLIVSSTVGYTSIIGLLIRSFYN